MLGGGWNFAIFRNNLLTLALFLYKIWSLTTDISLATMRQTYNGQFDQVGNMLDLKKKEQKNNTIGITVAK